MSKNLIETLIGFCVLIIAIAFFSYSYKVSGSGGGSSSYQITADFSDVNGILIGSDVKISGIKVGVVDSIRLDDKTYKAKVVISVFKQYQIPEDSTLVVASAGLLGGNYLEVVPGLEESYIEDKGSFLYTRSSTNIMDLILKFAK